MSPKKESKRAAKAAPGGLVKAAPWATLGLVVVILASMAVLGGPNRLVSLLARRVSLAAGAIDLTIVHSNDTYGYVLPCG